MTEYILILTMTMFGGGYRTLASSTAIEQVGGFATNAECVAAGNAWIRQQRAVTTEMHRKNQTAVCVARTMREAK